MNKDQITKAIEELAKQPKRKFSQTYDLIINLKNFSTKQNPVDVFATLPHPKGKKVKTACFVDIQLADSANQHCDLTISEKDFESYNDPKKIKTLAKEYDYFIAQATLMPKVAKVFGKILGMRGKMPNPKLGCVVPPNANLGPLVAKLSATVHLVAKKSMNLQCQVGKEDQDTAHIIENVTSVYNAVLKQLPNETQNVKNVLLKLTMGKPIKI